ncbi:hypothetical protein D4R86_00850 [bacterium]|nr:MAG: hypothetical protein D4R86_00850 [bacterium]
MKSNSKLPQIKVYARISLNTILRDTRLRSNNCKFGKVEQVAKQYGIKTTVLGTCIEFEAPKARMQMFVEKLHFAGVPFSEDPL